MSWRSRTARALLAGALVLALVMLLVIPASAAVDGFEPDNTWGTATTISTDGTPQAHSIDPTGDADWVKFEAEAGHPYRIALVGSKNLRLYLYAGDGTTLIDSSTRTLYDSDADKQLTNYATASGTLFVKVDSAGSSNDYTIAVTRIVSDAFELDNTAASAKSIGTGGVAQAHRIDPTGDADWVKFEAEAGHPYRIALVGSKNLRLYIYGSDGSTLIDSSTRTLYDSDADKQLTNYATASGTLYVKVDSAGSSNDYTIAVTKIVSDAFELDNDAASAKPIAVTGVAQHHRIDPYSDVDWVRFIARTGYAYRVKLTGSHLLRLYIYGSDGSTLIDDYTQTDDYDWYDNKELTHYATAAGTLYVKVDGGVEDYTVAVTERAVALPSFTPTTTVDFGEVHAGTSATRRVVVSNAASATGDLVVDCCDLVGSAPEYSITDNHLSGAVIRPGETREAVLAFRPVAPPAGAPSLLASSTGGGIVAGYSRYSLSVYPPYVWRNTGGAGVIKYSWTVDGGSEEATREVLPGDRYKAEAWIPTWDRYAMPSGDVAYSLRVGATSWSGRFSGTSLSSGSTWLTRLPDTELRIGTSETTLNVPVFGYGGPPSGGIKLATSLSMSASGTCGYASAKLSGYLKDVGGAGLGDRSVVIQYYASPSWRTLATVRSTPSGYYEYTAKPTKKTSYRAAFAGDHSYAARNSATRVVSPEVALTRPSFGRATLKHGKTYAAYGDLKPRHKAGSKQIKVKAYLAVGGSYVLKKTYTARVSNKSIYSKYRASIKLTKRGTWRLCAYHAADSTNAKTYSNYRYVTVK